MFERLMPAGPCLLLDAQFSTRRASAAAQRMRAGKASAPAIAPAIAAGNAPIERADHSPARQAVPLPRPLISLSSPEEETP